MAVEENASRNRRFFFEVSVGDEGEVAEFLVVVELL